MEFSGAAEGLGYNKAAPNDLFNCALDEPLSWWRKGQDHLTFGEFVECLARSPNKVAGMPQGVGYEAAVAADEAAVSQVAADKAAALTEEPSIWSARTSRSFVGDPPLMSLRRAAPPGVADDDAASRSRRLRRNSRKASSTLYGLEAHSVP